MPTPRLALLAAVPVLGVSLVSMGGTLAKLTIQPEKGDRIEVMFNPKEYSITKATPWKHHDIQGLDAPTLEFTSGEPYRVQLEQHWSGPRTAERLDALARLVTKDPAARRPLLAPVSWHGDAWVAPLFLTEADLTRVGKDGAPHEATVRMLFGEFTEVADSPSASDASAAPVVVRTDSGGTVGALWPARLDLYSTPRDVVMSSLATVERDAKGGFDTSGLKAAPTDRLVVDVILDRSDTGGDVRDLVDEIDAMLPRADGTTPQAQLELPGRRYVNARLTGRTLRYTMFLADGKPVRAVVNTVWKEFSPAQEQLKGNPRH